MKFEVLSLPNKKEWGALFSKLPIEQQDIYFTPEYYELYENNGDGKAQCFVFEENDEIALYPFLINSVNELGYDLDNEYFDIQGAYGYNGIVTNSFSTDFIDKFYKAFDEYCLRNNIIAEFIRFHPLLGNNKFSINNMQVIFDRKTVFLDLKKSYENIWKYEYTSNNRNMIRKAQKNGYSCQVITSPTQNQIDQFALIYWDAMKMVSADDYYLFNKEFFYNTFKYLNNNAFLFNIVDANNRITCSAIFLHFGNYFHYHLSGRTEIADNSTNNFLLNEAIKFAQSIGSKKIHFGGGRSTSPHDTLLKFKNNFSKSHLSFYIGKKIHNQKIYDEVVKQWETKFPEKKEKYNNLLLKYRY